jgi:hypothetical protein
MWARTLVEESEAHPFSGRLMNQKFALRSRSLEKQGSQRTRNVTLWHGRATIAADKTTYVVMFRDQNTGRSHNNINNSFFDRAEQFKYLRITLKNQNSIQEEIKSRLKSGKA